MATKSKIAETLQSQLSGYGTRGPVIEEVLQRLGVGGGGGGEAGAVGDMDKWNETFVHRLVWEFMRVRFPTVYVLNKVDTPAADANIGRICEKYPAGHIVVSSALGECFLKKLRRAKLVLYEDGASDFVTAKDVAEAGPDSEINSEEAKALKMPDPKALKTLEKIRDLVLFRYGSTGVQDAIKKAVEVKGFFPAYPVKNIHKFTSDRSGHVFKDCLLIGPGTTMREFARMVDQSLDKYFAYAEGISGQRLGEDEVVTPENNILKFRLVQPAEQAEAAAQGSGSSGSSEKKKAGAAAKKDTKDKDRDG